MLPRDIDEIEDRAEQYKRYERVGNIAGSLWLLWFGLLLLLYSVVRSRIFSAPMGDFEVFVPMSISIAISLIGIRFGSKGKKKFQLEDDEWVTYYANSVVESLEDYAGSKSNELKKDSRKDALKSAKEFLSYVQRRWSYGSFKLATDYFGKSIGEFQRNLQFRLIPSIEDGDDETLKKTAQIMYNLLYGISTLDTIKTLNTQMSERLPNREPLKIGMRNRLSNFLVVHRTVRDGLAVILSSIVAVVFYSLAIYFQWASRDYAFGGSVAIFIGLSTIYFTRLRQTD